MENPHFSLKTAVWTDFVALVDLEPLKFTLQNHPQFGFTASSWIQHKNPTEILVQVKHNSSDDFGSGRGPHPPSLAQGKIQQGEGWVWTPPARSESSLQPQSRNPADSTQAFCASSAAVQINAIKDLIFHGLGRHWGHFLVKNCIYFGVFSCRFLPS